MGSGFESRHNLLLKLTGRSFNLARFHSFCEEEQEQEQESGQKIKKEKREVQDGGRETDTINSNRPRVVFFSFSVLFFFGCLSSELSKRERGHGSWFVVPACKAPPVISSAPSLFAAADITYLAYLAHLASQ